MKALRLVINDFTSFIHAEKLVFLTILTSLTFSFFSMLAISRLAWAEYREMVHLNESAYSGNHFSWKDDADRWSILEQLTDPTVFPPLAKELSAFSNVSTYADVDSLLEHWENAEEKEGEPLQESDFLGETKGLVMSFADAALITTSEDDV